MNKRDDFDDRSRNSREDGHKDQPEDKGGSTEDDYNRTEDGSFSETPGGGAHSQQQEDANETNRIERLKKD